MRRLARQLPRLRDAGGYSLIELITVMVLMGTVMAVLVGSFTSGMRHEADSTRHEGAQENARLALQRMRVDIHCAAGLTSVDQNDVGGFTLTLTEAHEGQEGWCPGVIPSGESSVGVQWCTVPYPGSTTRFILYRFLGLEDTACGSSSGSTFQVDYVTAPPAGWPQNTQTVTPPTSWVGNIWPTGTNCLDGSAAPGAVPTAAVDLNVNLDPVGQPSENYELRDQLALRNAHRCD